MPAGRYFIGGWGKDTPGQDERGARIRLEYFWIARFPVTVAQYAAFIDDGGYAEQRYWTPASWDWKQARNRTQPWRWGDTGYDHPDQPVSGVTWYEAMAFCAWLDEQVPGRLPRGYGISLPTEAEWEAAAAYDGQGRRRRYPWGAAEPTRAHAVYGGQANGYDHPVPVGECPAGAAACGALDMSGQVWEWCRSSHGAYPSGAGEALPEFKQGEYDIPVRGGSWYQNSTNVRCAARYWDYPNCYVSVGFRVLLSPRASS